MSLEANIRHAYNAAEPAKIGAPRNLEDGLVSSMTAPNTQSHLQSEQGLGRVFRFVVLITLSAIPFYVAEMRWGGLTDDAYITLTYTKNILNGNGFVFNHPPAVLGTTTPLLTLVGVALGFLFPFVELSRIVTYFSAACFVGLAWTAYFARDVFRFSPWQAVAFGGLLLTRCLPDVLGMEMYVFQLLLMLCFVSFHKEKYLVCGLCTGLLYLTRGEGILFLVCALFWLVLRTRSLEPIEAKTAFFAAAKVLSGTMIFVVPWSLYAYFTFGHIFPNTLSAKTNTGFLRGFQKGPSDFSDVWLGDLFTRADFYHLHSALSQPIIWAFFCLGFLYLVRRCRYALILYLYIFLYIAGYSILGVRFFYWYLSPIYFVWKITAYAGVISLATFIGSASGGRQSAARAVGVAIVAACMAASAYDTVQVTREFPHDWRAYSYGTIARWMNANTKPEESLAFGEIGYLGYYTENRILDLAGIVTPEMLPYLRHSDPVGGFFHLDPDYFIAPRNTRLWARIVRHPRFQEEYELIADLDIGYSKRRVVYKKSSTEDSIGVSHGDSIAEH